MHRPERVGLRYRLERSNATRTIRTIRSGQETLHSVDTVETVRVDGDVTVLAVTSEGRPTQLHVDLRSLTVDRDGTTTAVFPPGTTLDVRLARERDDASVLVAGMPLDTNLLETVSRAISLTYPPEGERDDDVFGTTEDRAVGDVWYPDAARVAASFSRGTGMTARPGDVSVRVTVTGRRTLAGSPGLDTQMQMTMRDVQLPDLPAEFVLESAALEMTATEFLPDDLDLLEPRTTLTSTMRAIGRMATPRGPVSVTIDVHGDCTATRSLL